MDEILGGLKGQAEEAAEGFVKDRFGDGAAGMVGQFLGNKGSDDDDSSKDSDDSKDDDKDSDDKDDDSDKSDDSDDSDSDDDKSDDDDDK